MKLCRVFIGAFVLAVEISIGALEDDLAVVLKQYISGEVVAGNVRVDKVLELISCLRVGRARQYQQGRKDAEKHTSTDDSRPLPSKSLANGKERISIIEIFCEHSDTCPSKLVGNAAYH